jgi:hypothetical protein
MAGWPWRNEEDPSWHPGTLQRAPAALGPGGSAPRLREEVKRGGERGSSSSEAAARGNPFGTSTKSYSRLAAHRVASRVTSSPAQFPISFSRVAAMYQPVPLLVASLASAAAEPTVHVLRLALHGLMPLCLRYAVHLPSTLRQTAKLAHRERGGTGGQRKARSKEAGKLLMFSCSSPDLAFHQPAGR